MADVPDRVLELWREYQTALAEHGITNARAGDLASDEAGAWRRHVARGRDSQAGV
jgi:hypothetical protein